MIVRCHKSALIESALILKSYSGSIGRRKQPPSLDELAETAQQLFQNAFSHMDQDILRSARLWGSKDGATALTALHAGPFLFVANAGRI